LAKLIKKLVAKKEESKSISKAKFKYDSKAAILSDNELEAIDKKFEGKIKALNNEIHKEIKREEKELKKEEKELKRELKILKDVSPEEYFVLVTGTPLKNIKELIDALDYMDNWVFEHHVSSGRNDFAEWVKWSLQEHELADILHELRTLHETQNAILKYLVRRYL
jgi:hypothetical protein